MHDFFGQQDQARARTRNLVLLLLAGVAGLIALVNLAVALALPYTGSLRPDAWAVHAVATAATVLLVLGGMAWKWWELAEGGRAVALSLGGRELLHEGRSAEERRLRNVVEEMAIASGVPMPALFVLDEPGINAFAAGHAMGDAAVAVTTGCLERLSRDELQGVIAHEFSHILNGDMRLNLRLIALVHGLLVMSETGRLMLRFQAPGNRRNKDNGNVFALAGVALMVIGWAGWLMAQLVRAAVSRQREFLADASAVQFTRNPAGIAGALKRIAGGSSFVRHERAPEAAHLFFGQAVSSFFATHPPVEERIRRLDPGWDGSTPPPAIIDTPARTHASAAGFQAAPVQAATLVSTVGAVPPERIAWAEQLHTALPMAVTTACRDPYAARAAVLACLLDADASVSGRQLDLVARRDPGLSATAANLHRHLGRGETYAVRLAAVQLAHAALLRLTPAQMRDFLTILDDVAAEDGTISFDELLLCRLVRARLAPTQPPAEFLAMKPLAPACATLLGAMARIGSQPELAYAAGWKRLLLPGTPLAMPTAEAASIGAALDRLARSSTAIRRRVVDALAHAASADGRIDPREAWYLALACAALGLPLPAFAAGG